MIKKRFLLWIVVVFLISGFNASVMFAARESAGIIQFQPKTYNKKNKNSHVQKDKKNKKNGKMTIKELIAMNPPVKYVKGYIGKKYPSEWKEFPALIQGYKVIQLTTSPAEDSKFYLTTDSYFPDLNAVAFVSNRTGTWNIFYCSLANGEITQITDFPKSYKDNGHGDLCSVKTDEIVYYDKINSALRKVNLKTLKDTKIFKLPDGYKLGNSLTSNSNGSVIAITAIKGKKGHVKSSKMIFININGKLINEITRKGQQLSHVVINTSGKTPGVVYARKEIAFNKMFFFMSLDGKVDKKIIEAGGKGEGVSHPFWATDGTKICYLKKRKGKNPEYWLGIYDIKENKNYEYEKVQDVDMSANYNASLFVGDGTKQDPYLRFWRIKGGKLVATKVFRHGASFPGPESRDVHNTFIGGTDNVIFNSDTDGNGNVYVLIKN